jgi:hypothetical protein
LSLTVGGASFTLAFHSLDELQLCLFPKRSHLSLDEDEKFPSDFPSRVDVTPRHVRNRLQAEAHVRYEDVVRAVEERNLQDGAGFFEVRREADLQWTDSQDELVSVGQLIEASIDMQQSGAECPNRADMLLLK